MLTEICLIHKDKCSINLLNYFDIKLHSIFAAFATGYIFHNAIMWLGKQQSKGKNSPYTEETHDHQKGTNL